jgi:AcrR family transcriptional regulator
MLQKGTDRSRLGKGGSCPQAGIGGTAVTIHLPVKREGKAQRSNKARRQETEAAIIDAFERVLVQSGVASLSLNAVVKAARVGKKQVYDYFGGITGVASAWVERKGIWPPLEQIIGESMEDFRQRPATEKLRLVNRHCAAMLRSNKPLCELLTGEFIRSADVKEAVEHVRQLVRRDFERVLTSDPELARDDYLALNTVAYAATTYLALRAHSQPRFFGFDLSAEQAWETVLEMFDRVMDKAARGIAAETHIVD